MEMTTFFILAPLVVIVVIWLCIKWNIADEKSVSSTADAQSVSSSADAHEGPTEIKLATSTITGRVVDQYGKQLDTTGYSGDGYYHCQVGSVIDALGEHAANLLQSERGYFSTPKLPPGKYTLFINVNPQVKCFAKKVDVQLTQANLDLGDVEVVRYARVTTSGFFNEVGTEISNYRPRYHQYTDIRTVDPSFEKDEYFGYNHKKSKPDDVNEWGYWEKTDNSRFYVQLPPGKYSIEFAGGERYANKIITFEVADKDIDLGKIVLKKK